MNFNDLEKNTGTVVNLLKALSNERRLLIMCALMRGEKSVGELEPIIGLSQSALSQHLARLRRDGVVTTRRHGQTIYYSASEAGSRALMACLAAIYRTDSDCPLPSASPRKTG